MMNKSLQFILAYAGPLVSLFGIVVASFFTIYFFKITHRKDIKVFFGQSVNLFDNELFEGHDIRVSYKFEPIENLSMIGVRVYNLGRMPVLPADYEDQLRIHCGSDSSVIAASTFYSNPENISLPLKWHGNDPQMTDKTRVILEPIMLNPGDYVDFRILVSNSAGVDSEGRIAGVKDIHPAPYTIFGLGALGRQKASPHMTFRK